MKKFMKVCGITALIFVVLGAALALLGGGLQGRRKMQEIVDEVTGDKVKINLGGENSGWGVNVGEEILSNVVDNVVDGDSLFDVNDREVLFDKRFDILAGTVEKRIIESEIRELDIEVGACVFETKKSEDDSFWVEAENIGKMQCYAEDGALHVKAVHGGQGKISWNIIRSSKIVLYVPEDFAFDEVSIELGAGTLDFNDLNSTEINLEVGAGQINAKNLVSDELEMSLGAGEIVLKKMKVGNLKADVGMGNLEMDGTVSKDAELQCAMGNITFEVDGEEEDFDYDLECSMGNVTLGKEEFSGIVQERQIDNKADKTMNIECAMGNVEISFK